MVIYPFTSPIILNTGTFMDYGGKCGSFTISQLNNSFRVAEMQVSKYVGTLLLPHNVTGTYPFEQKWRLATDYGYVHSVLNVTIKSKSDYLNCNLQDNDGCAYIYSDTFGYIDFKQIEFVYSAWGIWSYWGGGYPSPYIPYNYPYLIEVAYQAGLPTGTATQPPILEALTIMAQIDLNEKDPGNAGLNESTGDIGVERFSSMDYSETRKLSGMRRTILGTSAKANRAALLIDSTVVKARRALRI